MEECVPIDIGYLHISSQLMAVVEVTEVYDDVGNIANVVAGSGGVRQSRSNTLESEVMTRPVE